MPAVFEQLNDHIVAGIQNHTVLAPAVGRRCEHGWRRAFRGTEPAIAVIGKSQDCPARQPGLGIFFPDAIAIEVR